MKATLKINNKEIEVDVSEEQLKELEEKKPSRKRWRAERGQVYFYPMSNGSVSSDIEYNSPMDDERYSIGNHFKTEEKVKFHKNELIYTQMLKDYIYEHDDVELNWNDATQEKWFLSYDYCEKEIHYCWSWKYRFQGAIFASNKRVLIDAVEFIGEENVKKYILKVEEE